MNVYSARTETPFCTGQWSEVPNGNASVGSEDSHGENSSSDDVPMQTSPTPALLYQASEELLSTADRHTHPSDLETDSTGDLLFSSSALEKRKAYCEMPSLDTLLQQVRRDFPQEAWCLRLSFELNFGRLALNKAGITDDERYAIASNLVRLNQVCEHYSKVMPNRPIGRLVSSDFDRFMIEHGRELSEQIEPRYTPIVELIFALHKLPEESLLDQLRRMNLDGLFARMRQAFMLAASEAQQALIVGHIESLIQRCQPVE